MHRLQLVALVATLALVGCSSADQLTPQASISLVAPTPSALASPSPTINPSSGVSSTTSTALVGPEGSIRDEMYALEYHPGTITAPAGTLVIFLVNPADKSLGSHSMAIGTRVGQVIASSGVVPLGSSAIFTVNGLPPGHYTLWCTVDDHAAEGMVGDLTIH